jgi:hypothetical protein
MVIEPVHRPEKTVQRVMKAVIGWWLKEQTRENDRQEKARTSKIATMRDSV